MTDLLRLEIDPTETPETPVDPDRGDEGHEAVPEGPPVHDPQEEPEPEESELVPA